MPSAQRTIVINRPIRDVFAFFAAPANDKRWRPHVKEIEAPDKIDPGTRIHQVVSGPGGRGIPADLEVTAFEVPDRYAFRVVAGPVRPLGELRFSREGNGTSVSFSLDAHLQGVKKLFMSRPVQSSMDAEMRALDTAKTILEAS